MIQQLKRVRWAVRATLILGVAASVVANVLHALDNPISQAIAAWPPLALLLTVELISRIPVESRWLATVRIVATAAIAGIAAWVSYWHMQGVATKYGETGASPYLLPLSVDGLIVVASICLVELGQRIRDLEVSEPAAMDSADRSLSKPVNMDSDLSAVHDGVDRAMATAGQELAMEAESFLAKLASGGQPDTDTPAVQTSGRPAIPVVRGLDKPRRVATGAPADAWPAETITTMLRAWDGRTHDGPALEALLAAWFGVSTRTVRRRRVEVLGPVSGPPA